MLAFNLTPPDPLTFTLSGIPGLEASYMWISIAFCIFYLFSLLGNFTLLFVVAKEQTLHKPMYLLICMLVLTDLGTSSVVMPKALCVLWFNSTVITLDGCLTQMFFFHAFMAIHSGVLVTMAFDRYVAICDPLRYATTLTNIRITKLVLVGVIRAAILTLPLPLLLQNLPFCASHVIPHTYCEHMAVVKLSCADTTLNRIYGLVVSFLVAGIDLALIVLSYGLIFRALLRMTSRKAYQKALNTCTSHLWVMFVTYVTYLFSSFTHRFGQGIPAHIHILFSNIYLLFPYVLNPIIYGVKTKDIREKVGKFTCRVSPLGAIEFRSR